MGVYLLKAQTLTKNKDTRIKREIDGTNNLYSDGLERELQNV